MSVPQCLIDRIGIEPCEGESTYARLVTDLPGLSIASIASAMPAEKWASARSAAQSLVPIGVRNTLTRLKALMAARGMNMLKKVDEGIFCVFGNTAQSGLVSGEAGVLIQKNLYWQSVFTPIRVNYIALKSPNDTTNIVVEIKKEDGTQLWTTTVASISANAEFEIPVNEDFYVDKIKVVIEGSDMQGYYGDCTTGAACCGEPPPSYPNSHLRSAFMVNAIEGGVVSGWKSPGVKVSVETPCGDAIFCQYGEELDEAALYFTGVAFLKEWQASTRLNVWALKKDWVDERITEWSMLAEEVLHLQVDNIMEDLQKCLPRCFKCRQNVGWVAALP